MISVSPELLAALTAVANKPLDLYELELDSGTLYYSTEEFEFGGNTYLPGVKSRSSIARYMDATFDGVSVTLSNVDTGIAQVLATEDIEGRRLIVRKIDRDVTNDSVVIFHGVMRRASKLDEDDAVIEAEQLLGSIDHEVPARYFQPTCMWQFKGDQCRYGGIEEECDRSWSQCAGYVNTESFGGFRFLPHSGAFQFVEVQKKRFLLFFSRKKKTTVQANWSAVDDTPYDVPLPIVYGRPQLTGITTQHKDTGDEVQALVAFCRGPIDQIFDLKANATLVADWDAYIGQLGGTGAQLVDPRFPDGYEYNLVAYVGLTVPSDVATEDPAPDVTGVVQGSKVQHFDAAGAFTGTFEWNDNAALCTRHFMTLPIDEGGMGVDEGDMDDVETFNAAEYCDEEIQDLTNDQKIYEPETLPEGVTVGVEYKRYRSTGVVGTDPDEDGPYSTFEIGVDDDTSRTPDAVTVKRFTMNAVIAEPAKAIDVLYDKLLQSFRGYLTYSKEGKIQIRVEQAAPNTTLTGDILAGATAIPVDDETQFAIGQRTVLGALTASAETVEVLSLAAGVVNLTAPTLFDHLTGEEMTQVAMVFDDSNIVGKPQYPLSERVSSYNRFTVRYVDAPAGFETIPLRINDYEHQARKPRRVNNLDIDGSAIDSYFQAWRIGQTERAKHRDLGKFVSLRGNISATLLEIGDLFSFSSTEHGLQGIVFRAIEISYLENDEVDIVGQIYSTGLYDDQAPQVTLKVPSVFNPILNFGPPPGDFTFIVEAPGTGDAVFAEFEFTEINAAVRAIDTGRFANWYVDETAAALGTLDGGIDDSQTTLTLSAAGLVTVGNLINIGGEMIEIVGIDNDPVVDVERGEQNSTPEAHSGGAAVRKIELSIVNRTFPPNFFADFPGWRNEIPLPNARVLTGNVTFWNARGRNDPEVVVNYSSGTPGNGLRTLSEDQVDLYVLGAMQVAGAVITPDVDIERDASIKDVQGFVTPDAAGSLTVRVTQDTGGGPAELATITFNAGESESAIVDGDPQTGFDWLHEGAKINLDIEAATGQWRDLRVRIRLSQEVI